jgi:mannose-6-phosphate isomerase-like protein (cupin superfamily)
MQGIHGKIIKIQEGKRTSLKYHKSKNEVFFILSGIVRVDFGNSKTLDSPEKNPMQSQILKPGDVLNVQSECPYRITALEDCTIIETGDKCEAESVRIEDDYGRVNVD